MGGTWSFRLLHLLDTTVVGPAAFSGRLERAGFTAVVVEEGSARLRFRGRRPLEGASLP
jgi:hypothetical protein